MKQRIISILDYLRSTLWFVPTGMAAGALVLAYVTVSIDTHERYDWMRTLGWVYSGGAEGARLVFSSIASSMITVAGVVFSIAIVALSLASQQFGPRLLTGFMRDAGNQVVLGTFIATFLYCLFVLRTTRSEVEGSFVPHVSVTVGLGLAVLSLGVLIFYIHHVSNSIQATSVIARVANELDQSIHRLFPDRLGRGATSEEEERIDRLLPDDFESGGRIVESTGSGYVQSIDEAGLLRTARDHDLLLRLKLRPGDYVVESTELLAVWPDQPLDESVEKQINAAFILGHRRTAAQDTEFLVHQLVEIAVRALSPGINDPYTAVGCVDRLSQALVGLAARNQPSPYRFDEEGSLRVLAEPVSYRRFVDGCFDQIRQYGCDSVGVLIRVLQACERVGARAHHADLADALRRQANLVMETAKAHVERPEDQADIQEAYREAIEALDNRAA